mmetsp:Transcript_34970/g.54510  ORF Transcript_34970/g.54510 Transcript_34970/m.54510 type:complete len:88 (+) Transcript_34970:28-291(+)
MGFKIKVKIIYTTNFNFENCLGEKELSECIVSFSRPLNCFSLSIPEGKSFGIGKRVWEFHRRILYQLGHIGFNEWIIPFQTYVLQMF